MANIKTQFDMKAYLESKLGNAFTITDIRNLDSDFAKPQIVITPLPSNIFKYHVQRDYQFDVYTITPDETMTALHTFIEQNISVPFVQDFVYHYPIFTSPSPMEVNIDIATNKPVRLVMFAKLTSFYDVNDIKSIVINNETIDFLTVSLPYLAQVHSNKVSGDELNYNVKQTATTALTMRVVPTGQLFFVNLSAIRQGTLSGKTAFTVACTFTNGSVETYKMMVLSSTFNGGRGQVPSLDISLGIME